MPYSFRWDYFGTRASQVESKSSEHGFDMTKNKHFHKDSMLKIVDVLN